MGEFYTKLFNEPAREQEASKIPEWIYDEFDDEIPISCLLSSIASLQSGKSFTNDGVVDDMLRTLVTVGQQLPIGAPEI
eukprot:8004767-Pyramimonas_sp.AAC.1